MCTARWPITLALHRLSYLSLDLIICATQIHRSEAGRQVPTRACSGSHMSLRESSSSSELRAVCSVHGGTVEEFDHIVVSAGSTGCVVAIRLPQDSELGLLQATGGRKPTLTRAAPSAWPRNLSSLADCANISTCVSEPVAVIYSQDRALESPAPLRTSTRCPSASVREHRTGRWTGCRLSSVAWPQRGGERQCPTRRCAAVRRAVRVPSSRVWSS